MAFGSSTGVLYVRQRRSSLGLNPQYRSRHPGKRHNRHAEERDEVKRLAEEDESEDHGERDACKLVDGIEERVTIGPSDREAELRAGGGSADPDDEENPVKGMRGKARYCRGNKARERSREREVEDNALRRFGMPGEIPDHEVSAAPGEADQYARERADQFLLRKVRSQNEQHAAEAHCNRKKQRLLELLPREGGRDGKKETEPERRRVREGLSCPERQNGERIDAERDAGRADRASNEMAPGMRGRERNMLLLQDDAAEGDAEEAPVEDDLPDGVEVRRHLDEKRDDRKKEGREEHPERLADHEKFSFT